MEIGLRLKLFRVSAGIKQRDLAQALGVTVNYVSMLERGKRDPTLKYLEQFVRQVGVPLSVLLWEPDRDKNAPADPDLYARVAALMAEYGSAMGVR